LCFSPFRIFWASADSHFWWTWPFLLIFSENVLLIYVHAMTEAKFWFNVFFPVNYPGRVQTRPFFIGICDRAYFRYFIELLNFASVIALVNASRILGKNMFLIEDIFIAALSADFWHIF
jgi:hypothetical protein